MNKSLLEVVRETAKDLYTAGLMDEVTLRKFDALCLPPLTETPLLPLMISFSLA